MIIDYLEKYEDLINKSLKQRITKDEVKQLIKLGEWLDNDDRHIK